MANIDTAELILLKADELKAALETYSQNGNGITTSDVNHAITLARKSLSTAHSSLIAIKNKREELAEQIKLINSRFENLQQITDQYNLHHVVFEGGNVEDYIRKLETPSDNELDDSWKEFISILSQKASILAEKVVYGEIEPSPDQQNIVTLIESGEFSSLSADDLLYFGNVLGVDYVPPKKNKVNVDQQIYEINTIKNVLKKIISDRDELMQDKRLYNSVVKDGTDFLVELLSLNN